MLGQPRARSMDKDKERSQLFLKGGVQWSPNNIRKAPNKYFCKLNFQRINPPSQRKKSLKTQVLQTFFLKFHLNLWAPNFQFAGHKADFDRQMAEQMFYSLCQSQRIFSLVVGRRWGVEQKPSCFWFERINHRISCFESCRYTNIQLITVKIRPTQSIEQQNVKFKPTNQDSKSSIF